MIALADVTFLRPLWLLAAPLSLLAGWLVATRLGGDGRWRRIMDADLMVAMRRLGHLTEARDDREPWLIAIAAAIAAFALSGPAIRDPDAPVLRNLDAVMILMDLSPSLTEGAGLDDAQAAVSRLIDIQGTRPIALAVYAAESFLVSVPTEDPAALQTVVAVMDPATMPVGGSRPDRALDLARQTLDDAGATQPDIVLVSDGGGIGPNALDRARQMAAAGMRISAVFVAQDRPPYGATPANREPLVALTDAGGGMTVSAIDLAGLEAIMTDRRGDAAADPAVRNLRYRDLGRWLLILALVPLAFTFRRRVEA
ncbi:VWA domain-containing protein [Paracoccus sp. TK19116]|uniref:VWA domain-containing protein n=1 Tax=Paracoccus albicereus TaxID=2922394 RepID=A0ABT1MS72_9RHOB|nr:vWA domain-containing protein [Paracoccus albicereus]MCQ0970203.1 VWA domain-containing protein [Paracoccus albicereus]